jgi:molecular chaperone DnaK
MTNYVGIDLGTTNTSMATFDGRRARVQKALGGFGNGADSTPSAIYIDEHNQMFIGDKAYRQAALRQDDVALGWKRLLGTETIIQFKAAGRQESPEWCSTELIKRVFAYLTPEVRASPETSVVITVPAAFNQLKNEATLQAAKAAGIANVKLMPEPVAACLAVYDAQPEDSTILVYDLGGGTFDVSVAKFVNGEGKVLVTGGVESNGGRDWDAKIVQKVILPWLRDNFDIDEDLLRSSTVVNLLLWRAEEAKVEFSQAYSFDPRPDFSYAVAVPAADLGGLIIDKAGVPVSLQITLTKAIFDGLVSPIIDETISSTRLVLKEFGVEANEIDSVVFIGGPTLWLPLREAVCDALGLPMSSADVNPMTAVALGASIYAEGIDWSEGSPRAKAAVQAAPASTEFPLSLNFDSRVTGPIASLMLTLDPARYESVEVEIRSPGFTTGQFQLNFQKPVRLTLTESGVNVFEVIVTPSGSKPLIRTIEISRTVDITGIPIAHSLFVEALSTDGVSTLPKYFVRLGESLPAKSEMSLKANRDLSRAGGGSIEFRIHQGEIADVVDDNKFVGYLTLPAERLGPADVIRVGDELILQFVVNEGQDLSLSVLVPSIGEKFDGLYFPGDAIRNPARDWQQYAKEGRTLKLRIEKFVQNTPTPDLERRIAALVEAINIVETSLLEEDVQSAASRISEVQKAFWEVRKTGIPAQLLARYDQCRGFYRDSHEGRVRGSATQAEDKKFAQAAQKAQEAATKGDDKTWGKYDDEMWAVIRDVIWRSEWWIHERLSTHAKSGSSTVRKMAADALAKMGEGDARAGATGLSKIMGKVAQNKPKQAARTDIHVAE